jgi:hypothetical protein
MTPTFPFAFWTTSADLMSGADGALSINATAAYINAGDIKRYSSISIINGGALIIRGYTYGVNNGELPTLIGCSGNCTIQAGSSIKATDNAGDPDEFYGDFDYSAPVIPFDCVVSPVSYTRFGGVGGQGGETSGYGTIPGSDVEWGSGPYPTGNGGGGAGYTDGGNTSDANEWGDAGAGGDSTASSGTGGPYHPVDGFSSNGFVGYGGEVGTGISVGGGGSGALRGISGGAIYIQIGGTASIPANSINVFGAEGGIGGDGGIASTGDDVSLGGGGGGGGAGGSGGYVWIRYKSGTVNASAVVLTGGVGGAGGLGGWADPLSPFGYADGLPGNSGSNGVDGTSDIATY